MELILIKLFDKTCSDEAESGESKSDETKSGGGTKLGETKSKNLLRQNLEIYSGDGGGKKEIEILKDRWIRKD